MKRSNLLPLAILVSLCLVNLVAPARAAITQQGDVTPGIPPYWDSTTIGYVGKTSNGTLTVDGGSGLLSQRSYIGYGTSTTGLVTVSGTGSTWTNSDSLYIGDDGKGTLDITNGGTVSSKQCYLGGSSGSSGTATVDGAGSLWTNEYIRIGWAGNGTLNITNGGRVSNTVNTVVGYGSSSGTINFGTNGGTLTTGSLSAASTQLTGTGTIISKGLVSDFDLMFDGSAVYSTTFGTGGTLAVDMSGPSGKGELGVGYSSSSTLSIRNGANVYSSNGYLGYWPSSSGTATVEGIGSKWNMSGLLNVGNSGSGILNITGGGTVTNGYGGVCYLGYDYGSSGTVTVDGAGSTWSNGGVLYVGGSGSGSLNITNGANVSNSTCYLAVEHDTTGVVTVAGAGSTWSNSYLYVGGSGSGSVNISSGGSVSVAGITDVEPYGSLTNAINFGAGGGTLSTNTLNTKLSTLHGTGTIFTKGLVSDSDLTFDASALTYVTFGVGGTITVDMSAVSGNGDLGVRYPGRTLSIRNGAKIYSNNGHLASGTITVDGAGSQWTNSANLYICDFSTNDTGRLNITNGGTLYDNKAYLGDWGGSSGTATVDGAGSKWTNYSDLYIGDNGRGLLNITNGGIVTDNNGYLKGTVTVDGAGSKWKNNADLYIGYASNGLLNITNGGSVTNNNAYLGYYTNSSGTVTVDGVGSNWTSGYLKNLVIGRYGKGILNITNGGSVESDFATLGSLTGSSGTVTVDGDGSKWTNNYINVGGSGTGIVTQTGGTTFVGARLYLGISSTGNGTYNLNGGTLIVSSLSGGSGTAAFNFGGGTLQAYGSSLTTLPMTLTGTGGDAKVDSAGFSVTLAGVLSGTGGLNKLGANALTLNAVNTYTGPTTVSAGTLSLGSAAALDTSSINVATGAAFNVSAFTTSFHLKSLRKLLGKGTVLGNLVVDSGGILSPGDSPLDIGILSLRSNLALSLGAVMEFDLASTLASDLISMPDSTLTLDGQQFDDFHFEIENGFGRGVYTLIQANAIQGALGSNLEGTVGGLPAWISADGGALTLTVVPEPSTLVLLVIGIAGTMAYARQRSRKRMAA